MKRLAGVSALVAIAIAVSASVGGPWASAAGAPTWTPTRASTGLLARGWLRCTATVQARVQAGQAVTVRFTLHNRSRHPVTVSLWVNTTSFVLDAADGTRYDSGAGIEGFSIPPPIRKKIPPGATWHLAPVAVRVRWRGPLLITPGCLGVKLHALRVDVAAPWPRPDPSTALGEVVAAAGHLFDHCLPQTSGVPVDGQIYAPGNVSSMDARCSISVSSEGTFLVAQTLVLVPHGLSGVQVYQPYETLWPIGDPFGAWQSYTPPYEAIAWEFVVTRNGAIPVATATVAATCDSALLVWGGTNPDVEYVAACSA